MITVVGVGAKAQISVGMHNTRYIYGEYEFGQNYHVGINHSVFSEKFKFQQVGISVRYTGDYKILSYSATAYAATAWNCDYKIVGGKVAMTLTPLSLLHICGSVNPLYDSGYKYKTCFSVGGEVDLSKNISVGACYTTIPDYRKSEKRVHGSFTFHVGGLSVRPTLSLPVAGEQKFKGLRVMASFNYRFGI